MPAAAQQPNAPRPARTDSARAPFRTGDLTVIPGAVPDSLRRIAAGDTLRRDSARTVRGRDLREPVKFSARDRLSLRFDSAGVGDVGTLTGDARVQYGAQVLEAYRVTLLLGQDEVRARGLRVDTGIVGRPKFAQGEEQVVGEEIAYNLRTERGRFLGARTKLDDGFVRAAVVKVAPDSTVYARDAIYTTCPCVDDPSYSLRAGRMKIVDGKRVYTGPIQLYLFNIPMPFALPFGFLPATEGRRAGPLAPSYGEDELGFYLRNLGWYFPISDYLDLQVVGGVWSRGSWEIAPTFRYARRYHYSGSIAYSEGRSRYGEPEDPGYGVRRARAIRVQHGQTIGVNTNLNANVNLATSDYLYNRSTSLSDRVSQNIQSTVNYATRWPRAGRSLTVTATQNQTITTGAVTLGLPSLSFSQNERRPFQRRGVSGGQPRWFETISYAYRATFNNAFSFQPLTRAALLQRGDTLAADISWYEALASPDQYRRATGLTSGTPFALTARHDVPISATFDVRGLPGFPGFRANVVPNVSYSEQWYNQTEQRVARDTTGVDVLRNTGFFALRQVSATLSANTTFYGLFPVRVGAFDGVRHTVRPNVGVTFAPDYSAAPFRYVRSVTYNDPTTGQPRTDRYAPVPGVSDVRQAALQFSLDNVFETRRVHTDTTGIVTRTPLTLLNLSVSGSYNAAADSFRLSPLNVSARSELFGVSLVSLRHRVALPPPRLDGARARLRLLVRPGPVRAPRERHACREHAVFGRAPGRSAIVADGGVCAGAGLLQPRARRGEWPATAGLSRRRPREPDDWRGALRRLLDPVVHRHRCLVSVRAPLPARLARARAQHPLRRQPDAQLEAPGHERLRRDGRPDLDDEPLPPARLQLLGDVALVGAVWGLPLVCVQPAGQERQAARTAAHPAAPPGPPAAPRRAPPAVIGLGGHKKRTSSQYWAKTVALPPWAGPSGRVRLV